MRRWRKRGASAQAIGRTKGGRNTKIHAISDEHCRPLAFYLTPGQTADIKGAVMLSTCLPDSRYLLADKAYDADHWRQHLKTRCIKPVIPNKSNRKQPHPFNKTRYKGRNVIERMFGRLKDFRPRTSWLLYALLLSSAIGFEEICAVKDFQSYRALAVGE